MSGFIHWCLNVILSWIRKISVRFKVKLGKDSITVHLLQIENLGAKNSDSRLVLPFRKPHPTVFFFVKPCSNDVFVAFASVSFLRTFTRKFSKFDVFLKISSLKDDELVMSEM